MNVTEVVTLEEVGGGLPHFPVNLCPGFDLFQRFSSIELLVHVSILWNLKFYRTDTKFLTLPT